ncbi:MAG: ornithine carbamoyltransferase [Roseateles sp.]
MYPDSWLSRLTSHESPPAEDAQALLRRAQALQQEASPACRPLAGKRLGLMSAHPEDEDGRLFEQAACELGAHVARIAAPAEASDGDTQRLADIGRLLGRLYDTVECQGMGAATVQRLAQAGNLPVLPGLASREHWLFQLAQGWPAPAPLADRRRWLVQAALLAALD